MIYSVIVQPDAIADTENIFADLQEFNAEYAEKWIAAVHEAVANLNVFPKRHPIAAESARTTFEVRQLLVGHYRILFAVRGISVQVMRIRHASRRPFKPGELN